MYEALSTNIKFYKDRSEVEKVCLAFKVEFSKYEKTCYGQDRKINIWVEKKLALQFEIQRVPGVNISACNQVRFGG